MTPALDPAYHRADVKKRYLIALQILLIVLATAAAYLPTLENGFTNWDDPELILKNDTIKGLTGLHLRAIFTNSYAGFGGYTPLVLLSYAVEHEISGLDPKVFHVDNLVLHALNTLLIYALLVLIGGDLWIGFVAALLFGVHPLHVEAVAWIQGRKDLLFSFFFIAAAIGYQVYLRRPKRPAAWYALSLALFGCALFSKVAAISFPLVVLLLESHERRTLDKGTPRRLAPFLGLAAAFLVLAFLTMRSGAYGVPTAKVPMTYLQNLGQFFYAFVFYVGKIVLPVRLFARYPLVSSPGPLAPGLSVAVFTVACAGLYFYSRRDRETVRFGAAFFILTLLPTLPFHFAGQPYADRYAYLPLAGLLFILAAWLRKGPRVPARAARTSLAVRAGLLLFVVALLGLKTQALCRNWRDSLTLWTSVLRYDPRSAVAYLNRSQALIDADQPDRAMADLDKVLPLDPKNPKIYLNRGVIRFMKGDFPAAMAEFTRCVEVQPRFTPGYFNRGLTWGRLKQFPKAIEDLTTALGIEPGFAPAYYYRGLAQKELGRTDLALADFRSAYRLGPNETLRKEIESLTGRKAP